MNNGMTEILVSSKTPLVAFCWPGFPDYAARSIASFIDAGTAEVAVVATKPGVPVKGMEESLGQSVHWVLPDDSDQNWIKLLGEIPDLVISVGYSTTAFESLRKQAAAAGRSVILASDHNWTGKLLQRTLYPLRHRLIFRRKFAGVFVPGKSGRTYHRNMGYADTIIFEGLYGADPEYFFSGPPLSQRSKTLVFIGQLIERKNVVRLCEAFAEIAVDHSDWTLRVCGSGMLAKDLPKHAQIAYEGFLQPEEIGRVLRECRALVLPSHEEHWGVVVHEAASSGCALLLSSSVGSTDDLADHRNARIFEPTNSRAIKGVLSDFMTWNDEELDAATAASAELAQKFGPAAFTASMNRIVEAYC